jgi:two-component system chemotaxis response regulator CheY
MKLRALVIDDSRVMRQMVMAFLKNTGLAEFEFTEAEDGADGFAKFHPKKTDIIFVDWNMPKMTGIDFVRKVRTAGNSEHIPIIMVTSEKSLGKIADALDKAGANEYITKPFTVQELQRKLGKLLAEAEANRQEVAQAKSTGFFGKLFANS